MSRQLSIVRRRPGIVDLVTPDLGGNPPVVFYAFKVAPNFDAPGTLIATVPRRGLVSPTVVDNGFNDSRYKGKVRFLFNPADYTGSAGIFDTSPFFIQMATQPLNGALGAYGALQMIIPYEPASDPPVVLAGDAPSAADISGSLEIQLPRNFDELTIKNVDSVNLHIAFHPGGPEYQVDPNETFQLADISISQMFVRGEGGICTFNAVGALQNSSIK